MAFQPSFPLFNGQTGCPWWRRDFEAALPIPLTGRYAESLSRRGLGGGLCSVGVSGGLGMDRGRVAPRPDGRTGCFEPRWILFQRFLFLTVPAIASTPCLARGLVVRHLVMPGVPGSAGVSVLARCSLGKVSQKFHLDSDLCRLL